MEGPVEFWGPWQLDGQQPELHGMAVKVSLHMCECRLVCV